MGHAVRCAHPIKSGCTSEGECSADLRVWFGSVRFWPEQICAVTDSVSEQQRSVRLISAIYQVCHDVSCCVKNTICSLSWLE